jgi:hypothetical protein
MIQSGDISELVESDSIEASALKVLITHRFFERLIERDRVNVLRDWRASDPGERVKLLDSHAALQTFCDSFITIGELIRNQGEG